MSRQAIMRVSRELLDDMLRNADDATVAANPSRVLDSVDGKCGAVDYGWLERVLHLPSNAKITGVSTHMDFIRDLVAVRVDCPDFVETHPSEILPTVEPYYSNKCDGDCTKREVVFDGWFGADALTEEYRQRRDAGKGKCAVCGYPLASDAGSLNGRCSIHRIQ